MMQTTGQAICTPHYGCVMWSIHGPAYSGGADSELRLIKSPQIAMCILLLIVVPVGCRPSCQSGPLRLVQGTETRVIHPEPQMHLPSKPTSRDRDKSHPSLQDLLIHLSSLVAHPTAVSCPCLLKGCLDGILDFLQLGLRINVAITILDSSNMP